jgi:hypothetical protein
LSSLSIVAVKTLAFVSRLPQLVPEIALPGNVDAMWRKCFESYFAGQADSCCAGPKLN